MTANAPPSFGTKPPRPPRRRQRRRDEDDPLIPVHLCCNDPHHGTFTGRLYGLDVPDEIRLMGPMDDPSCDCDDVCEKCVGGVEFEINDGPITVAGRGFETVGWSQYVGSWCWDATRMHLSEARSLIRHLFDHGFGVEEYSLDGPLADLGREWWKRQAEKDAERRARRAAVLSNLETARATLAMKRAAERRQASLPFRRP